MAPYGYISIHINTPSYKHFDSVIVLQEFMLHDLEGTCKRNSVCGILFFCLESRLESLRVDN